MRGKSECNAGEFVTIANVNCDNQVASVSDNKNPVK